MADAAVPPAEKPVPIVTPDSREFFEGAKQGKLMLQRCGECRRFRFVARRYCPDCGSPRSEWQAVSGRATLVSFVRVHQKSHPAFVAEIPYPVAWVELEEGPRLMAGLVDVAGVALKAGMPLSVRFVGAGPELKIPKFAPGGDVMSGFSGGCHCGAIRYTCDADPGPCRHCQCSDCRRLSGSGHMSNMEVPAAALHVTGEPHSYDTQSDRGTTVTRRFCGRCGSPVYSTNSAFPDLAFLRASSLDDPTLFKPTVVFWTSSAPEWDHMHPDLERWPKGRPPR